MAPSLYAVVSGSAYGERQLMQVRARSMHPSGCKSFQLVGRRRSASTLLAVDGSQMPTPRTLLTLACDAPAQFAAQQRLTAQLRSAIKAHRDTWVTQADISMLASLGVNAVRLPVGYWVLAQTQVRRSYPSAAACCLFLFDHNSHWRLQGVRLRQKQWSLIWVAIT